LDLVALLELDEPAQADERHDVVADLMAREEHFGDLGLTQRDETTFGVPAPSRTLVDGLAHFELPVR